MFAAAAAAPPIPPAPGVPLPPPGRSPRSAGGLTARTLPPLAEPDATDAPKLDGRRTHIVDRALDYVALADQGLTASRIARKRRRSQGYVSIVLRLGRAVQGMEPGELAALRSPRVTWKLAQRIVREDADIVSIRHQLRTALGGFSTHNVDGRKHRKGRRAAADAPRAVGVAWGWDAAWFARDPVGYVDAHLRYLLGVHGSVEIRARRAVAVHGVERLSVGQSIRSLQRSLSAARPEPQASASPAERRALDALDVLARKLAEASAELATLLDPPLPSATSDRPPHARRAALGTDASLPSTSGQDRHSSYDLGSAIEEDLRD